MNEHQRMLVEYGWWGETLNVYLSDHILILLRPWLRYGVSS